MGRPRRSTAPSKRVCPVASCQRVIPSAEDEFEETPGQDGPEDCDPQLRSGETGGGQIAGAHAGGCHQNPGSQYGKRISHLVSRGSLLQ